MTFKIHRRHAAHLIAGAIAAATSGITTPVFADDEPDADGDFRSGKLFICTNSPAGNEVLVYARASAGPAVLLTRVATQGNGSGTGLGSQGSVTLSRNGRYLFVVNAGSNSVTTFAVGKRGLVVRSVTSSGGLTPTSITENDGVVFVLNAGGSGNITGFINEGGLLRPVPGAVGTLSANTGTAPAQVGLNEEGDVLVVSERNTNVLTSFLVRANHTLEQKTVTASSGAVPFGFAFTKRDVLVVSEAAASSVSSYRFRDQSATPLVVTGSLPNTQGAACWIAVTPNGKLAFSANAATSSVSSFSVAKDGQLALLAAQAGLTGANAGAVDMAVPPSGTQLHVFASRAQQIVSFAITANGALVALGAAGGMPGSAAGLAAN